MIKPKKQYHAEAPIRCGSHTYTKASSIGGLTPQYAMVYLATGQAVYQDNQTPLTQLKPGDIFQRFPNRPHEITAEKDTHTYWIALPELVLQLMHSLNVPTTQYPVIHIGTKHNFIPRFTKLSKQLKQASPYNAMKLLTEIQTLMVDIHLYATRLLLSKQQLHWIEKACKLLNANLDQRMSIPGIAEQLNIGYSLFRKRFKQAVGITPGEYRVRRRIESAQEMILTHLSFTDIAQALGYADLYAFSAQFKKFTGLSPQKYRQSQQP